MTDTGKIILLISALFIVSCEDKPKETPQNEQDNPLLKLQEDTLVKAQEQLHNTLQKAQETADLLDKIEGAAGTTPAAP